MRENLPPLPLVLAWVALLALLGATLILAYVPMGPFNAVAAIGISVIKALLVVIIFMKLADSGNLVRFAAAAGLFWLAILFSLGATDYLTRTTVPTGSYTRGHLGEESP
ncbi:cytochrome C oxidase subunit IV family protein [Skermanella rosea]|uniref:cytochrome C oxidase subunit IV family protein n=1 Tax=Skermanella rosea TaxID=1817965 RepID=UPI001933199F|nr:cytochrome C oxidase subunit IV family protein [Skermanella rosea]UEM01804.1 cytochrome C oxidase subunit IV family protein [Skermanella rosea]